MLLGISATIKNAHRYLMGILSETDIPVSAEWYLSQTLLS
jgi:hypothetical protein